MSEGGELRSPMSECGKLRSPMSEGGELRIDDLSQCWLSCLGLLTLLLPTFSHLSVT
jgi:hypothetical protein